MTALAIPFVEADHRTMIDSWCRGWDIAAFATGWLPPDGIIVPDAAACWLYRTPSRVVFVDNMIRSPDASEPDLAIAFDSMLVAMEEYARNLGGARLIGHSGIPSLWLRASQHGFRVGQQQLRTLDKVVT